jgi:EAL domain-containing protein (putative c-di-GMP-specific phosphodiesterase class I)
MDEGRLTLYAQPIFGLKSGRTLRHELLVRMVEGAEVIEAHEFVGAAECDGLIRSIDSWGVGEAIALAAGGMAVNVNVSAESIGPDLLELMQGQLVEAGADPANLVL